MHIEATLLLQLTCWSFGFSWELVVSLTLWLFAMFYWPSWSSCLCCFICRNSLSVFDADLSVCWTHLVFPFLLVSFVVGYLSDSPGVSEPGFLVLLLSSGLVLLPQGPLLSPACHSSTSSLPFFRALFLWPSLSRRFTDWVFLFEPQDFFSHSCFHLSFTDTLKTSFHTGSIWWWTKWSVESP